MRTRITAYAMVGTPHHNIAVLVGITTKTLLKYYRKELDYGKAHGVANVAGKAYKGAMAGDKTMICFFLKCMGGWRETHVVQAQTLGADGNPTAPAGAVITFDDGGPGVTKK
jgi:hypothetical protein